MMREMHVAERFVFMQQDRPADETDEMVPIIIRSYCEGIETKLDNFFGDEKIHFINVELVVCCAI